MATSSDIDTTTRIISVYENVLEALEERISDLERETFKDVSTIDPLKATRDRLIIWASDVGMSRGWLGCMHDTEIAARILHVLRKLESRVLVMESHMTSDSTDTTDPQKLRMALEQDCAQLRGYVMTIRMRASLAKVGPDQAIRRKIDAIHEKPFHDLPHGRKGPDDESAEMAIELS